MNRITRRRFIRTSVGSVAAMAGCAAIGKRGRRPVVATTPRLGPNENIRVALIGSGGMGRGDMNTFLPYADVEFPVVCDVDDAMIAKAVKAVEDARGKRPEVTKDFRRIMDRTDIHACLVATPDHWHALPTIHACQSGKDVYIEKPLATSIGEGKAMLDAARRYDRVVQMGTQWRSAPHWREAVQYAQSGKLGKIRLVRCWAYLAWVHSVGKPADCDPPEGVDYDVWLGPAPKRPFNPARFHFSFRWFWDYAGGLMTDWGVHLLNIALWAMGPRMPERVSSSGGKYIFDDISETPDTQHALYDYGDYTLVWEHQMEGGRGCEGREHGVAFHGTEGTLIVDAGGWEVVPAARDGRVKTDRKQKPLPAEKHEKKGTDGRPEHVRNFLDCCRSREQPVENVEIGHFVSTAAHLGNIALRSRQSIRYDALRQRVVGHNVPEELLTKRYRAPWKLGV